MTSHPTLVLRYSRVGSPLGRAQAVPPLLLRWQMRALLGEGYRPASLMQEMATTERLAGRFCVTFDGGFAALRRQAVPLLSALRVPATIFVVVGAIGQASAWDEADGIPPEPLMTLDDLKAVAAAGVEIGSLAMTHTHLTRLPVERLKDEVLNSKHLLEDLLGRPVHGFAYPYGDVNDRVRDVVAEAGYRYATTTHLGALVSDTDPYRIPRLPMRWNTLGKLLESQIHRAYRESVHEEGY